MTAPEVAKQAGLKSLAELSRIAMIPIQTLRDWHDAKPEKFQRLCEMAAAWKWQQQIKQEMKDEER